jgi:hypothetical protein
MDAGAELLGIRPEMGLVSLAFHTHVMGNGVDTCHVSNLLTDLIVCWEITVGIST